MNRADPREMDPREMASSHTLSQWNIIVVVETRQYKASLEQRLPGRSRPGEVEANTVLEYNPGRYHEPSAKV